MPPFNAASLCHTPTLTSPQVIESEDNKKQENDYQLKIVWRNVMSLSLLHLIALYGVYLAVTQAKPQSIFFIYFIASASGFGILVGAHRLWCHRGFKAHWSLRLLLMVFQTLALQNDIYEWSRDHRVHHKFSETDADPHNSKRGFFFAHMGWLMCKKHPEVLRKGKSIDLSDLWSDPIVRFQRKLYIPLVILIWGLLPTLIPYYFWQEHIITAFALNMLRYSVTLHSTWLVNSAAHMWGSKPYDKNIEPRENYSVNYLTYGEGYHNYHHTFPYDYSASELGWTGNFNLATLFIDFFALIGLAYDRKTVPKDIVMKRHERTGEKPIKYRNGKSFITDLFIGIVIGTWPLWFLFGTKFLINHINVQL